jgi:hypothetical protein
MSSLNTSTFFDSKTHDVILQSSDGFSFYLIKASLSIYSSVFEATFSLPAGKDEVQTVRLEEDGKTLELLPRHTLLPEVPSSDDFDQLVALLTLCDKYDLRRIPFILLDQMLKFVKDRHVEVWAYAAIHGAEGMANLIMSQFDEARIDVDGYLRDGSYFEDRPVAPSEIPIPLLSRIPPASLHHLMCLHELVSRLGRTWDQAKQDLGL